MDNKELNPFLFVFSGEASSGKHVTNMDTVRNLEWATYTCTLGINTFGRLRKLTFLLWFINMNPVSPTEINRPTPPEQKVTLIGLS